MYSTADGAHFPWEHFNREAKGLSERKEQHIMVVGGHCLDAEVMAGGIVAKYTKHGHKASIVHATPGEKGHKTMSPEDYAKQKIEEAKRAAAVLGAEAYFLPYKDAELPVDDEAKYALADLIRQLKPTVILTHWKESIHKDHTNTALIVEDARFYAALPAIKRDVAGPRRLGPLLLRKLGGPYTGTNPTFTSTSPTSSTPTSRRSASTSWLTAGSPISVTSITTGRSRSPAVASPTANTPRR